MTFLNRETQFGFGVAGGVNQPVPAQLGQGNTFKYTGRGEHDAIFNLEKLVGLPKGTLLVRLENWYGEYGNVSLRTGSFAPAVFPAMLPPSPNEPGIPFLTNFLWTQPLSERLVVFAGKKDVLGSSDQDIFAGGDGTDQFVNQALIANPAFLLGLPYTSFTAGFASPRKWGGFRGFIYDPTDRTMDVFRLDNLFSRGIIVGGEIRLKTKLFRRPGQHHVGGIWKHVPLTNLAFAEPPPGVYPEPTVPGFPTIRNSYTLYYGFDQYLVQFSDSDRGWGLFGRASISDGNPTPIQYFLSCGLGGYSPFAPQRNDTFGLGWYFVGASTEFGPLPRALFGPRNGTGVELYYNFQIKSWLNITPDVQFIRPGAGAIAENAFVYGIRVNARY
ncbi:MAG TPA: carbohydrate porin [Pirellulales bacterium]|nr:carbohydrate porin [Pirellulales bacterium]